MITTDFDGRYFRRFYLDEKTQCASESDLSLQAVRAFSTAASLYGTTKLNVAEVGAGRPKLVEFPTVGSVAEVAAYRFCAERSLIRPRWLASDSSRAATRPSHWPAFDLGIDPKPPRELVYPRADLVLCTDVLGYVKNLRLAADSLARIGKPSSLLYLTYPTATDRPDMDPKRSDMRQHFHAHAAVKATFVERGWRELGLGFWMRGNPPPYAWGVDLQR